MSSPPRRSIWLITLFLCAVVFAFDAPAPSNCGDIGDSSNPAPECAALQMSATTQDELAAGAVSEQPTPNSETNGDVVWVWVAFSTLGVAVLAAGAAANRPPKTSPASTPRRPPLQESLAHLDRAS